MATEEAVLAAIKAAKPAFRDDHDRVAFAAHAAVLASGYSLVAAGRSVDAEPSEAKEAEATSTWNDSNGTYAFRYAADDDPERTMTLKGTAMGESLMLDAAADSRTTNTELKVKDYVADTSNSSYAKQYKKLRLLVEHIERDILKDLYPPTARAKSTSPPSQGKTETSRLTEGETGVDFMDGSGDTTIFIRGVDWGFFPCDLTCQVLWVVLEYPEEVACFLVPMIPGGQELEAARGLMVVVFRQGSLQELDLIRTALLEFLDLSQTDLAEKVEGGRGRGLTCTLMCNISTPSEPRRTGHHVLEGGFVQVATVQLSQHGILDVACQHPDIGWKDLRFLGIIELVINWVFKTWHALSKDANLQGQGRPVASCQMLSQVGTATTLRLCKELSGAVNN
eukprot:SM000131S26733  [mRNA]  locus=s131:257747:260535:- [translate_table: standard]